MAEAAADLKLADIFERGINKYILGMLEYRKH